MEWHNSDLDWMHDPRRSSGGWWKCRSDDAAPLAEQSCRLCHARRPGELWEGQTAEVLKGKTPRSNPEPWHGPAPQKTMAETIDARFIQQLNRVGPEKFLAAVLFGIRRASMGKMMEGIDIVRARAARNGLFEENVPLSRKVAENMARIRNFS